MSLELLTGKTGSGKSARAVELILVMLDAGTDVFTNIFISVFHPNYHYIDELGMKEFISLISLKFDNVDNLDEKKAEINKSIYANSNFFIDEAHLVGFKKKTDGIQNWLTIHRHFGQNIWVITQIPSNIHRDYLEMFHHHTNMIPQNKRLLKNSIGYRRYDAYKGESLGVIYYVPHSDIFELYNTGTAETGMNRDVVKLGIYLVGLSILLYSLYGSFKDILNIEDEEIKQEVVASEVKNKIEKKELIDGIYISFKCFLDTCTLETTKQKFLRKDLDYLLMKTDSKVMSETKTSSYLSMLSVLASPDLQKRINIKGKKDDKKNNVNSFSPSF